MHDETYKKLFASADMVADLVRAFAPEPIRADIDYDSLRPFPSELVSRNLQNAPATPSGGRRSSQSPTAPAESRGPSTCSSCWSSSRQDDHWMALRMAAYTALLCQTALRRGSFTPTTGLPTTLPIVIHRGDRPWRAPRSMQELIQLSNERLRRYQLSQGYVLVDVQQTEVEPVNLMSGVARLEKLRADTELPDMVSWLDNVVEDEELRDTFQIWIEDLAARLFPNRPLPLSRTLQELKMNIEERIAEWRKPYIAQGLAQGRAQGRAEGATEGEAKGLARGRAQIIASLLRSGMSRDEIQNTTGATAEELDAAKQNAQNNG